MWVEVKKAKTLMMAEMWKEFFEGEGIPTRLVPVSDVQPRDQETGTYRVLVPKDKQHLINEILRKL